MLKDYLCKAYKELFKVDKVPTSLMFRLNNIAAGSLIYKDFIHYFDLKNSYEALYFILDDQNMEDIMRYSLNNRKNSMDTVYYPPYKRLAYSDEAKREHEKIDKYTERLDREFDKINKK